MNGIQQGLCRSCELYEESRPKPAQGVNVPVLSGPQGSNSKSLFAVFGLGRVSTQTPGSAGMENTHNRLLLAMLTQVTSP